LQTPALTPKPAPTGRRGAEKLIRVSTIIEEHCSGVKEAAEKLSEWSKSFEEQYRRG
jgi:hypothetical protein